MIRNKQVVVNIMVVLALVLGLGVFPVGATIPTAGPITAVESVSQTTKLDAPVAAKTKDKKPDFKALDVAEVEVSNDPAIYMIRLADSPLAAYSGGIPGLRATGP